MKGFMPPLERNASRMMSYPFPSGQLTNLLAMSYPVHVKHAVLQMTLAMRDAASLPWPAVRAAWASSMHQVEGGNFTWAD